MTDAQLLASSLRGVLCATVTPFDPATLEVDWGAVRHNAEWLVERGVGVLVVNGSIGEPASLDDEERVRLVRETVTAAAGRAVVVAGCSDADAARVARRCSAAAAAGAAGALIHPPSYFRLSAVEVEAFFGAVDRTTPIPFVVYDNPAVSRASLPIETIDALVELDGFAGLKEADPDVVRFHRLVERFGDRIPVIAAVEDPLLFLLVAGARACMTASAAFAPGLIASLMDAVDRCDLPRARNLFARITRFRALFRDRLVAGEPAWLPWTKAAVDLVGGQAGPPRPPLEAITGEERVRLKDVLSAIGVLPGGGGTAGSEELLVGSDGLPTSAVSAQLIDRHPG